MAETGNQCGDPNCTGFHPSDQLVAMSFALLDAARSPYLRPAVGAMVGQAVDTYDGDNLWAMCELWAEAWRIGTGLEAVDPAQVDGLSFVYIGEDGKPDDSTATTDVDAVSPGARFAARFLMAFVQDDTDQRMALANSVAGDRDTVVDAVGHLLMTCAHGINQREGSVIRGGDRS